MACPRDRPAPALFWCALAWLGGCHGDGAGGDAGSAHDQLTPAGPVAIGLTYGQAYDLAAVLTDGMGMPAPARELRFQIFGDPAGSTLSADRAITDLDGRAAVRLSAGAAEASFRVTVASDTSDPFDFAVAVSRFAFLEVDVHLDGRRLLGGPAAAASLRALVYPDRRCGSLPPAAPPPSFRAQATPGPMSTLRFPQLALGDYSLLGLALDAGGRLRGDGCVDVSAADLPPGGIATLEIPLHDTVLGVDGAWILATSLPLASATVTAPWDALSRCARAPAQQILDALRATLIASGAVALATAIDKRRGPVDGQGCRPLNLAMGGEALDGQLETLLTPNGAPGLQLGAIAADLDAIVSRVTLDSRLDLIALGPPFAATDGGVPATPIAARHTLTRLHFASAGALRLTAYDPSALGLPVTAVGPIPAGLAGDQLGLGDHSFTARLPVLWRRAFADVALTPRGLPVATRALLAAVLGAATRSPGGRAVHGCAALSDLVCAASGVMPCDASAFCESALDGLATALDAPFAAPVGVDLTLHGGATVQDLNGNLLADTLSSGTFNVQAVMSAPDHAQAATATWSAVRAH